MKNLLITIVTSTFNAFKELPMTIESIKNQSFKNYQWIIIDGGSLDGTKDLIKENEDCVDFWLSDSDQGIYDAWNKAICYIKGDWVIFLGAGDVLYSNDVLYEVSLHLFDAHPKYNLVYGKVIVMDDKNDVVAELGKPWDKIKNTWETITSTFPPHPGCFLHTSFFKEKNYNFPVNFKIVGDSHLLMTAIVDKEPLFINMFIDKMLFGGVSNSGKNLLLIVKELKQINREFNIKPPFHIYYWNMFKIYLKVFFYIAFPKNTHKFLYNSYLIIKNKQKIYFKNLTQKFQILK